MTRLKAPIFLYTTRTKTGAFQELLGPWLQWVHIKVAPQFGEEESLGWNGYNQLFKSEFFWRGQDSNHIVIFQPDSLLIKPLELDNLAFGYAGAPWNKGRITSQEFPSYNQDGEWASNDWISQSLCQTVPNSTNGNGGLSIRNRALMQQICSDHASQSPPEEAEDIFFAKHIHTPHYKAKLPSQGELRQLFNETSFADTHGFHGSWFYLDASDQAKLYETHVKHVIGLLLALS